MIKMDMSLYKINQKKPEPDDFNIFYHYKHGKMIGAYLSASEFLDGISKYYSFKTHELQEINRLRNEVQNCNASIFQYVKQKSDEIIELVYIEDDFIKSLNEYNAEVERQYEAYKLALFAELHENNYQIPRSIFDAMTTNDLYSKDRFSLHKTIDLYLPVIVNAYKTGVEHAL